MKQQVADGGVDVRCMPCKLYVVVGLKDADQTFDNNGLTLVDKQGGPCVHMPGSSIGRNSTGFSAADVFEPQLTRG